MNFLSKASPNRLKPFSFKLYIFLLSSILTATILMSCASSPKQTTPSIESNPSSITYSKHESSQYQSIYHLITIQLNAPEISIISTPPSNNSRFETIGETTSKFSQKYQPHIAINASPFSYPASPLSSHRMIEGIYIHEGTLVSEPNSRYAALCFYKNKKAYIVNSQTIENTQNAYFAFGGFWTILDNNEIIQFEDIKDSRTAIGISEDGFTLYILVVEKNAKSTGMSFMDCAIVLQHAGAIQAMQLDGGGSSGLILKNAPTNSVYSKRKVANNIGFCVNN